MITYCAEPGCTQPKKPGKSKYCVKHAAEHRAAWKEMIAAKGDDKEAREAKWQALYDQAHAAGLKAGEAAVPPTMIVEHHVSPFDDNSPVDQRWVVPEGPCGFAWVNITPGNSSFALWLKGKGIGHKAYQGGWDVWISQFGQSMARKEAYAAAFAGVVREAGLKAYAHSRMD